MVQQCQGKIKVKGGKSSLTGLNNVTIIMVRWKASILSLGSGDGIPVLVGQNEGGPKMSESLQYNTIQWRPSQTANCQSLSCIFQNNYMLWIITCEFSHCLGKRLLICLFVLFCLKSYSICLF